MKNVFLLVLIVFFQLIVFAQAKMDSIPLLEKVYLHTDRNYYFSGDDVWFKAYLVDALEHKLINQSKNLYVELISPIGKIVLARTVKITDGIGIGDFHINDSINSGQYQLRAYTNWMRNFDEDFFFKKELIIQNAQDIEFVENNSNVEQKVDLQFFPEGGSLVLNVPSFVAFKAIDQNGLGIAVSGSILSSKGDTIQHFQSSHLGMGKFSIIPANGLSYYAIAKGVNGILFSKELPQIRTTGFTLHANDNQRKQLKIVIRTNNESLKMYQGNGFKIEIRSANLIKKIVAFKINALVNSCDIALDEFRDGLIKITLYSPDGLPQCERLVYLHLNPELNIKITTDKKEYSPWSLVNLNISVTDSVGKPVKSTISVAVLDKTIIKNTDAEAMNIKSWLMLETEINGTIENPAYYFDYTNPNRKKDLDLLLLTQGWHDFKWKYSDDKLVVKHSFSIEKGFTLSGKLRKLFSDKPIADANITLALFDSLAWFYTILKTDSIGKYTLDGIEFNNVKRMLVTATGKSNQAKGWIQPDSLLNISPRITYTYNRTIPINSKIISGLKIDAVNKFEIKKKYHLNDVILLDEVLIKDLKKTQLNDDGQFRMYNYADAVFDLSKETTSYTDVFQYLRNRVPGVDIGGGFPPSVIIRGMGSLSGGEPLWLMNGMAVDIETVATLSIEDITKIEILKGTNTSVYGLQGSFGVISIFTKFGSGFPPKKSFNTVNVKIKGYDSPRVFYSPNYATKESRLGIPDLRTSLFWEPNFISGLESEKILKFYNFEKKANIEIRIEGLTETGIPFSAKSAYQIE